jgi:hypothetical protein
MERSEGDMSLKIPVTPPGIDPGTVRLVAQRLNHYATPGPLFRLVHSAFDADLLNKEKKNLQTVGACLPGDPLVN